MSVEERDVVDRCFHAAHDSLATAHTASTGDKQVYVAQAIVHALEGLTHQVRDADDTQFAIQETIVKVTADLGVQLAGEIAGLSGTH